MTNTETAITEHPRLPDGARNQKNEDGQYERLWARDGAQIVELERVGLSTHTQARTVLGPIEDHLDTYEPIDGIETEQEVEVPPERM